MVSVFYDLITTNKNTMTIKDILIKFQEYQLKNNVLNLNCAHNAVANLFLKENGIENCTITDVSCRSFLFKYDNCYNVFDGRTEKVIAANRKEAIDKFWIGKNKEDWNVTSISLNGS